ncbi:hypothetical protein [Azospirillum thermophilum]|uniref:Uncharacterized protein n=1 Tax=Azospirillum thermophilum TaxID=2202148 RepID=A0A2S2CKP0_9PROT|nr:hypothetical protein [Azospirillum thermophilum]AWK85064.1 hypothetical protein DEW08_01670 [Azospirillum thermophilum]
MTDISRTTGVPMPRGKAIAALTVEQLRRPRNLVHLPHGIYARAVRHRLDPLWGLAGDEPELWAELENEVRDADLTWHEPPLAAKGSVMNLEDAARPLIRHGTNLMLLDLIDEVWWGFAGKRCGGCDEPVRDCTRNDDDE